MICRENPSFVSFYECALLIPLCVFLAITFCQLLFIGMKSYVSLLHELLEACVFQARTDEEKHLSEKVRETKTIKSEFSAMEEYARVSVYCAIVSTFRSLF